MQNLPNIDAVLIQWGERLFYPGVRMLKPDPASNLRATANRRRAAALRTRIAATVPRAPQVMVKVTGGGRGMKAITAHFRYISKNGRLKIEEQHGRQSSGQDAVHELAEEWRYGGSFIEDVSDRREAFNLMLSMPRGTDSLFVLKAAREFAQQELAEHKYVMVLHDHQTNPHVHISVRAESNEGRRLNPRKADLHRWRECFAEKLQGYGIEAEASRQTTRGRSQSYEPLWRIKAREAGRLRRTAPRVRAPTRMTPSRSVALAAWTAIERALAASGEPADRELGRAVAQFVRGIDRNAPDREQSRSPVPVLRTRNIDIDRSR